MDLRAVLGLAVWCSLTLPASGVAQDAALDTLPPAGYGTLKQDDIALRFETPTLQLRIMPLDERVIRLLAPDSYEALAGLKRLKAAPVDSIARWYGTTDPSLFVVTFFGLQPLAEFNPDDVTVTSRNRFFRPLATVPVTPGWSEQRLRQRETATAIYVFESGIFVLEPFTVSYAGATSDAWERILRTLDQERAAVIARAAAGEH